MTNKLAISEIKIGARHRKDMGDLGPLAMSIKDNGLLQPIGISSDNELVFGERRLRACRDVLGWEEIDVRLVNVSSIAAGEYAENEIRKNFTPSERVAIMDTIKRYKHGGDRKSDQAPDLALEISASKQSGFSSRQTASNARKVVNKGIEQLREAMDKEEISIDTAALIAGQPEKRQKAIMKMDEKDREGAVRGIRAEKNQKKRAGETKYKTLTIPWNANKAAYAIKKRGWPRELVMDFIKELRRQYDCSPAIVAESEAEAA